MSEFIYYMHDGPRTFRFELAGKLSGSDAHKLEQAWRTASSTLDGKTIAVDVTFLTAVDEKARMLLERWWRAGAHFVANSALSQTLVESITGQPYAPSAHAVGPTFDPLLTAASLRSAFAALAVAVTLLFPAKASGAADLKQETLAAWDQGLQQQDARMLDRAKGTFLWAEESPERLRRLRAGEVLVAPMIHAPQTIPSGLIHHWIGAAFIPGARIEDVIAVVRDYDRYSEFYKPSVIEGKTLSRKAVEDRFSVVVVQKEMYMKRALQNEYHSRYTEVGRGKWISVARTSRVQELSRLGVPVPDGEASGYIWRLSTLSRYEERDGGVYLETEALALSRTIPAPLHWLVDPVVRRVARSSLTMTLGQTRDATGSAVKSATALAASRSRKSE